MDRQSKGSQELIVSYPYSEFGIAELDIQEKVLQSLSIDTIKTILKSFNLALRNDTQISILRNRIADLFPRFTARHISDADDCITALVDGIAIDDFFKLSLLIIVKCSASFLKDMPTIKRVASTAITILNRAKISFAKMDLSGVQIPGADLSYGNFDGTNFEGANLNAVNFRGAYLYDAKFKNNTTIEDDIKKFTPLFAKYEHERQTDKVTKETDEHVMKNTNRKKPYVE